MPSIMWDIYSHATDIERMSSYLQGEKQNGKIYDAG